MRFVGDKVASRSKACQNTKQLPRMSDGKGGGELRRPSVQGCNSAGRLKHLETFPLTIEARIYLAPECNSATED